MRIQTKRLSKRTYLTILSIILVLVTMIGTSFGFLMKVNETDTVYTTGVLSVELVTTGDGYGETINLSNTVPMTNDEAQDITPYKFIIKNTGNLNYQFDLKLVLDEEKMTEDGCTDNTLSFSNVKIQIDDGTPVLLSELTNSVLLSDVVLASKASKEVSLRVWLDENTTNEAIGKHFHAKLATDGYAIETEEFINLDNSGANIPDLVDGMIPVYYDDTSSTWKKADPANSNINYQWYDYDNKMWANAVMVTSDTRETYMSEPNGTQVLESDILAYYVWIPKYRYQLFNVNSESMDPIEIQIEFEDIDSFISGSTNGEWLTHPAFTLGDTKLSGIWMGKFETTGSTTAPTIKPSTTGIDNQAVSVLYSTAQLFGTSNYLTSIGVTEADAHMMKNIEWGAAAYLKQSKYGLGTTDITMNGNSSKLVGCGPISSGSTASGTTCNVYNTAIGVTSSTTGNVYGIYGMAGGIHEYVLGAMMESGNTSIMYASSGLTTTTLPFDSVYIDLYNYGSSETDFSRRILGDATGETNGWYTDLAQFVYSTIPWFGRGGSYTGAKGTGVFNFYRDSGGNVTTRGFRSVIINK